MALSSRRSSREEAAWHRRLCRPRAKGSDAYQRAQQQRMPTTHASSGFRTWLPVKKRQQAQVSQRVSTVQLYSCTREYRHMLIPRYNNTHIHVHCSLGTRYGTHPRTSQRVCGFSEGKWPGCRQLACRSRTGLGCVHVLLFIEMHVAAPCTVHLLHLHG